MSVLESCDHCGEKGVLGREIRAFRFRTPKGVEVLRFLHPNDGERRCYHEYEARYRAWMAERQASANG